MRIEKPLTTIGEFLKLDFKKSLFLSNIKRCEMIRAALLYQFKTFKTNKKFNLLGIFEATFTGNWCIPKMAEKSQRFSSKACKTPKNWKRRSSFLVEIRISYVLDFGGQEIGK